MAAVVLLGVLLDAGGGGWSTSTPRPARSAPASAATARFRDASARHRLPVAVEAVSAVPNAAEGIAPRSADRQLLLVVAFATIGLCALLATRLRREQGSYTLPWGTGSTSTRGPPALLPA